MWEQFSKNSMVNIYLGLLVSTGQITYFWNSKFPKFCGTVSWKYFRIYITSKLFVNSDREVVNLSANARVWNVRNLLYYISKYFHLALELFLDVLCIDIWLCGHFEILTENINYLVVRACGTVEHFRSTGICRFLPVRGYPDLLLVITLWKHPLIINFLQKSDRAIWYVFCSYFECTKSYLFKDLCRKKPNNTGPNFRPSLCLSVCLFVPISNPKIWKSHYAPLCEI